MTAAASAGATQGPGRGPRREWQMSCTPCSPPPASSRRIKNAPKPAPDMPSAEQGTIPLLERSAVIAALRTLPPRQREALVLKYYADLSEAQIASTMGISRGAVKSHTARGTASLRSILEVEACS